MTTPTPPERQFGPMAGEPGSAEHARWLMQSALAEDGQQLNTQTIHEMAAQGIAGADSVALMVRVNVLIDYLFGDLQGNPGLFSRPELPTARVDLEIQIQRTITQVLRAARAQAERGLRATGREHRTSGGIILPGSN